MTQTTITIQVNQQQQVPAPVQTNYFNSSALRMGTYDPVSQLLRLTFRSSTQAYDFEGVHPSVWQELIQAESAGVYYNNHIRPYYGN